MAKGRKRIEDGIDLSNWKCNGTTYYAEGQKRYYERNKEKLLARQKIYREEHKEYFREYQKQYKKNLTPEKREKIDTYYKNYYYKHRDEILAKSKEKRQIKRKEM